MLAYTSNSNLIDTQDPTSLNRLKLTTPGLVYNLRHAGQYADSETGLFYNYFRTYDPKTGRYSQNDPIGLGGGLNRFGYVEGNPLRFTDPEGLQAYLLGYSPLNPRFYDRLNPRDRSPPGTPAPAANQAVGAAADFWHNYRDMRTADTIGADKYFHCKANCQASRRGRAGEDTACMISDSREWFDQTVKGDPVSASQADQAANAFGRGNVVTPGSCDVVCSIYRPNGMPSRY